jgi:hypothetical protein
MQDLRDRDWCQHVRVLTRGVWCVVGCVRVRRQMGSMSKHAVINADVSIHSHTTCDGVSYHCCAQSSILCPLCCPTIGACGEMSVSFKNTHGAGGAAGDGICGTPPAWPTATMLCAIAVTTRPATMSASTLSRMLSVTHTCAVSNVCRQEVTEAQWQTGVFNRCDDVDVMLRSACTRVCSAWLKWACGCLSGHQ